MKTMRKFDILFGMMLLAVTFGFASSASAQAEPSTGAVQAKVEKPAVKEKPAAPASQESPAPVVTSLGGLTLGLTADEAKDKLGKPDVSDKTGMLFTPSGTESIQIGLDEEGKIRTIAHIYTDGDKKAPSFEDVFGPGVEKPESTGTLYKMVRYPEAGMWLSYSLTNADSKPMTVVTMRRIK